MNACLRISRILHSDLGAEGVRLGRKTVEDQELVVQVDMEISERQSVWQNHMSLMHRSQVIGNMLERCSCNTFEVRKTHGFLQCDGERERG